MLPKGWSRRPLGEIAQISSGGTPDRTEPRYWGGNIPWVTTGEIRFNTINDTAEKITELGLKKSSAKLYPAGTLLLAMYGQGKTRGQVAKLGIEAASNQNSAAILLTDSHDPDFLFQYLMWKYKSIRDFGHTGGISHLNAGLLKIIPVPVAPLIEQRRIAVFLQTWDRAIATNESLLINSRKQKQALMQKLLFGRVRLRQFLTPWTTLRLRDVLKEVKRRAEWDDNKTYPLISVRRRSEGAFHRESLKGNQILTKKLNLAQVGDLLISKMQVVHGAMAIVPPALNGMYVSDSYLALRSVDQQRFDTNFLGWLSATKWMYRAAYRSSYGVHIEKMTFDFDAFLEERIFLPSDIEEQRIICDVLDQAQAVITSSEKNLQSLRQEKAALMAQLLTGKRRVRHPESGLETTI
jgi:type I restriction enzyme, S subunit